MVWGVDGAEGQRGITEFELKLALSMGCKKSLRIHRKIIGLGVNGAEGQRGLAEFELELSFCIGYENQ
jgi:hypothetical protein